MKTVVSEITADDEGKKAIKPTSIFLALFNTLVMVALLAMGSVPWGDVAFLVFATIFFYVMHRVVFPPHPTPQPPVERFKFPLGPYLKEYVLGAFVVGELLPLALIGISFSVGDKVTVREAGPHLFLLAAQVISENLTFSLETISYPIKALIPSMYNARRILNLSTWAVAVFSRDSSGTAFNRGLAVVNVILWNYNLWGFLLPVFVPWSMQTYYTVAPKRAE